MNFEEFIEWKYVLSNSLAYYSFHMTTRYLVVWIN